MPNTHDALARVPELVGRFYDLVAELAGLFPGRHFTLDGHLVGSLGEVWAAYLYDIALASASEPRHDGRAADGRPVQIKATQAKSVGLRSCPEHLVVLRLRRDGTAAEVYNGPGETAWSVAGRMQKNGQRAISLARLGTLMEDVPKSLRLPLRHFPTASASDQP